MIRVLQIVPNMQAGGLENFIMNIYRKIDRESIQFDFLVHYKERKHFDDEIEKLGGKIYRMTLRDDNNIFKYMADLNSFYKEHPEYKIIHCHMSSIGFINFFIAKKNGVKVRIAHSHNSNTEKNIKGFIKSVLIKPLKYISTHNFACSNEAGKFLFGKRQFEVIPNAIDMELYRFNSETRKQERERLNIENKLVVGHIGRFELQKNHKYIIDVFKEVIKVDESAVLLLAGDGSLIEKIKLYVKKINIESNVKFLGVVKDANKLYQAMDCFILPSFFEGLPVVGIEAQVSGLRCLFSSAITKEVKISQLTKFLGIKKKNIEEWKENILNFEKYDRENIYDAVKDSKYNIKTMVSFIQNFYTTNSDK